MKLELKGWMSSLMSTSAGLLIIRMYLQSTGS